MSNSSSQNRSGYDSTPEERLQAVYDTLKADATNLRAGFEDILDKTDGQYLIVRDTEGRELIKISFIGGIIVAALALFLTRLRWIPLMPVILAVVYARLSFQIDRTHRDNAIGRAVRQIENE